MRGLDGFRRRDPMVPATGGRKSRNQVPKIVNRTLLLLQLVARLASTAYTDAGRRDSPTGEVVPGAGPGPGELLELTKDGDKAISVFLARHERDSVSTLSRKSKGGSDGGHETERLGWHICGSLPHEAGWSVNESCNRLISTR